MRASSVVILAAAFSYIHREGILLIFLKHIEKAVFLAPQEAFISYLKLSFFTGLILASPVVIYEIWAFVRSAMKPVEKKYAAAYGASSLLLFLSGAAVGYFAGLPIAIDFLLGFAGEGLAPMISVERYINFCGALILAFAVLFELPLIVLFMTGAGFITPRQLSSSRRYVIVGIFVAAALLSPPDVFTQVLLAVPLWALFEISLLLAKFVKYRRRA